ncbi:hypothetical protein RFI_21798 [Reticulomyxa filosa]|uniref:Peptidase C1A papain C-terminal domain-containing protein n=1 Tax=Reticulomyxa filosa TaxID=46433 RepID=X6MQ56_RETFI|nr:hypothetical protein RFI_21798 [Reticulomyxa filosa]|eukprot:ETO15567.1 hypothetical protein RFI_21798 [Reticulomyxa filosa]
MFVPSHRRSFLHALALSFCGFYKTCDGWKWLICHYHVEFSTAEIASQSLSSNLKGLVSNFFLTKPKAQRTKFQTKPKYFYHFFFVKHMFSSYYFFFFFFNNFNLYTHLPKHIIINKNKKIEKKEELKAQNGVEENQLEAVTKLLREQLEIKDREWYPTTYKTYTQASSETCGFDAAANVFGHVTKDHSSKDDNLYYRFVMNEVSQGKKEKNDETSQDWSWGDLQRINLQAKVKDLSLAFGNAKLTENDTFGIWSIDKTIKSC